MALSVVSPIHSRYYLGRYTSFIKSVADTQGNNYPARSFIHSQGHDVVKNISTMCTIFQWLYNVTRLYKLAGCFAAD
jgi:hypothetical protein